jgi:hypothetical protein
MDPRLVTPVALLDLQARLYLNCLAGMSDEQALRRPSAHANHAAFVALHLLDSRHVLARLVGAPAENRYGVILERARGIEDVPAFPPLEALRAEWSALRGPLADRLAGLEPVELDASCPAELPVLRIGEGSVLDAIGFLLHHEAYHIGQLALLRRLAGLDAMSYR